MDEETIRNDIFCKTLSDLICFYGKSVPIPFEFLVTGLITVSSSFCGKSRVSVKRCFKQPISFFSVYVGPVSSRKSSCIELFKDEYDQAVDVILKCTNIFNHENKISQGFSNCSITIESLLKELSLKGNIMQFWDEFNTFLSSFGLYISNGVFDNSMILTLYNSPNRLTHTLKSYELTINKPRLSIFTAGHEFLITCPKPKEFSYDDLEPVESVINFEKIFVAIRIINLIEKEYVFEDAAFNSFKNEAERLDKICLDRYGSPGNEYFYNFVQVQFFKLSNQTMFSRDFLIDLDNHITRNQVTFEGYTDAYNRKLNDNDVLLYRKRLSEIWFGFKIRQYQNLYDQTLKCFDLKESESFLENFIPKFQSDLLLLWNKKHDFICSSSICKETVVFDGNLKCNRLRCIVSNDAFNITNNFGCPETASLNSYYCKKHIENKSIDSKNYPPDDFLMIQSHRKKKDGKYEFITLFDKPPKTRVIEEEIVEKWTSVYGDYFKEYHKKNTIIQSCQVDKDFNLNKRRTTGILLGAAGCGFVLNFQEMIKSESLNLVSKFLYNTIQMTNKTIKYCIYDNSFHLNEYFFNHYDSNDPIIKNILKSTNFVIDNFHIQNHSRNVCYEKHYAKMFSELENYDTQICEQNQKSPKVDLSNVNIINLKYINSCNFGNPILEYPISEPSDILTTPIDLIASFCQMNLGVKGRTRASLCLELICMTRSPGLYVFVSHILAILRPWSLKIAYGIPNTSLTLFRTILIVSSALVLGVATVMQYLEI
ncbi:unnamed protein product [Brachionus calyciflorus]|uniref:Uncharacterized protein n=1 Tax=Brachionus calyciflorus TaxID=104777 RepID=A0A813VR21_9BILA|nr:unnamed protein product [Brachionus calyciflorus]